MNYKVEIKPEMTFEGNEEKKILNRKGTAIVTFIDDEGEKKEVRYGYIPVEEIYEMIKNEKDINLNQTYIEEFDWNNCIGKEKEESYIKNFTAINAFFNKDTHFNGADFKKAEVDFSEATFGRGDVSFDRVEFGNRGVDFSNVNFGEGDIWFDKMIFKEGKVDFSNATFGKGRISFSEANFGEGKVDFSGVEFGNGEIEFIETIFGNGDVNFEEANFDERDVNFSCAIFGEGNVDFSRVSFGEGNVNFSCAIFGEGNVDFSRVSFGEGNVDFFRTEFNKGDVKFSGAIFGKGGVYFYQTIFGEGNLDFSKVSFGEGNLDFSGTIFGEGNVDFFRTEFNKGDVKLCEAVFEKGNVDFNKVSFGEGKLSFDNTMADNVFFKGSEFLKNEDFRFEKCGFLRLEDCIINGTFDLQANFDRLELINVKNPGQIYHDWYKHKVKKAIYNQKDDTSFEDKAKQFSLLKENFGNLGQYDDEDCAYFEFKRCMRKSKGHSEGKQEEKNHLVKSKLRKLISGVEYIIFELVGGYGTKPKRVFFSMLSVVSLFSVSYIFIPCLKFKIGDYIGNIPHWIDAVYYSGITFLTVGYGDISPVSRSAKLCSVTEGFLGIFLMSYFTVAFVRKLLR